LESYEVGTATEGSGKAWVRKNPRVIEVSG
jgi:hypothetical protein